MPELIDGKKIFLLSEFTNSVQRTFEKYWDKQYWLKAEIAKLNFFPKKGHCYPELVENVDGKPVASVTGFIHNSKYKSINNKFLSTVGEPLKDGMKVAFLCEVGFSPTRGLRITILDVDIDSVIGEQTRRKRETILKLKSEGIFASNKRLSLPRIVKNIAVVSVESGKGFADFMSIINQQDRKFKFKTELFSSTMLGSEAAKQIIDALDKIRNSRTKFDVVCIIRGGGSENSLQCFNDLDLSKQIATFPLPVLTGIGHATNVTVAEEVAYKSFVTPSELANFVVEHFRNELAHFNNLVWQLKYKFDMAFARKNKKLESMTISIQQKFRGIESRKKYQLYNIASQISFLIVSSRELHLKILERIEQRIVSLQRRTAPFKVDPKTQTLRLAAEPSSVVGVFLENRQVLSVKDIKMGDTITLSFPDGEAKAVIVELSKLNSTITDNGQLTMDNGQWIMDN